MIDRPNEARIITNLDRHGGYKQFRIKEGDEHKTAVQMRYGQLEYQVMPFYLINPPARFQSAIDVCLGPYIDNFAVCYLHDILIYSTNEKEHEESVCQLPLCLSPFSLNCNADRCQFGVSKDVFLGFVFTPDGIGMESVRISTIKDCLTLKSIRDVQVLHGFTNFC